MPSGQAKDGYLVGTVLGGRYRVTELIGRGGMGVVARAVDEALGREVAVKVLRVYTDASPAELADMRSRMRREAQAAARIRHVGVVTVYDVTEEQGLPVIVMELVDGPSLDDVVTGRGALDPYEAAAIGAKLMGALDAAHEAGILHRDVKPGNVLLERGGRVVLTDFGIATMHAPGDEEMAKLTRSGQLVGSLDYLPPERAQGREPGPASDIWSLGMTLYAAVEGVSPFRRTSVWSTLAAIVAEPLPAPRRAGPLGPVLQALMAKEPERRPTADQARALLEAVAAGAPLPAAQAPAAPRAAQTPAAPPAASAPAAQAPAAAAPTVPPAPFGPAPTAIPTAIPTAPSVQAPSVLAPAPVPGFGPPPPFAGESFPRPHAPPHPPAQPLTAARAGATSADRAGRRGRVALAVAAVAVLAAGGATYAVTSSGDDRVPSAAPAPPAESRQGAASPSTPPQPSPVPTGCTGWTHSDPKPGAYGYISGDHHLLTAPYQPCAAGALVKNGTKLWYQCYVVNSYGNQWTYVRVDGSNTTGWLYNRDLTRQKGSSPPC
ncbi:serine/threonine-protein kinase [Streptomyces sp. NRRL F-2747]|uniref:serine/threonine-protein kinase n=1 Tax=Streptomyces sp. NRRL F-2747 TaxID=1463843 RepID=UPI00055D090C|nr:serine/threonine-protein kinase [Streptomyces sp. NRRL F-2747]